MSKFRGKGQIPRLGSKFRGPRRKTVGLTDLIVVAPTHMLKRWRLGYAQHFETVSGKTFSAMSAVM